ncbi:MAG TPA: J domain-containing protein [Kofleriaceae bacterium]|nr:J domain-containing protein [Kofleriaceae bacterium]
MSTEKVRVAIHQFVDRAHAALEQIDYYRILGVSSAATEQEIRDAYYKLAARLHPDIHGDDTDTDFRLRLTTVFSRVVEAYRVLSDQRRRRQYDEALAQGMLRLGAGMKVKERVEEQIADAGARRFFLLAQKAMEDGDSRSAIMNLRIASTSEPNNPVIQDALARAEAMGKK